MRFVLALIVLLVAACTSSSEKESPIPSGFYVLQNDEETVMFIDEEGYFSWHLRTCSDWLHDDKGSLEREPDGSIRIIACSTHQEGGAAYWAPNLPATRLRARVTDSGFVVEGVQKGGHPFTQEWRRGESCRSSCDCQLPAHRTGC